MKKRTPLLMLLAVAMMHTTGSSAKQRTFNEAYSIAELQARRLGVVMDAASLAKAKSLNALAFSGKPVAYYVFPNGENKGFTIVSGDDRLPEIVGYSDCGTYSEGNLPEAYRAYLEMYRATVDAALNGNTAAAASVSQARQRARGANGKVKVAPLLGGIKWNQDAPFNNLCPAYSGTSRAATGCVATAMAQVMAYWKYPSSLQATIPAYTTQTHYIRVKSISEGAEYDWDNMLDNYNGSYSATEANAVATLMLHCGAAVQMDYSSASGAFVTPEALATYFGYDADLMQDLNRNFFSLDEWSGLIDTELKAGRPVLYSGSSSAGGHEFVCDGADGNGLYHINWGWGGYQDGYFDLTILNPEKGGIGSGTAADGYNRDNDMIIGIQPDNGKTDEPLVTLPSIVMYKWYDTDRAVSIVTGSRSSASGTFRVNISDRFCNYSYKDFSGYYGYGVKNADGSYKLISDMKSGTLKGRDGNGGIYGFLMTGTINYAFPVGVTTVYSLYSTDGRTWQRCLYANELPVVFEATDKLLYQLGTTLAGSVSADGGLLGGYENSLTLTLTNSSDDEYHGLLNIYSAKTDECPSRTSTDVYVVVPAKSTVTREFKLTPSAGNLYVWVKDAATDATIVDGQRLSVDKAGTPVLSLVSASSNAVKNLYESSLAYYQSDRVRMPKTNDAEAVFTYGIKNTGDMTILSYIVWTQSFPSNTYKYTQGTVKVPGNGETTYVTVKNSPSEFSGERSLGATFYQMTSSGGYEALSTSLGESTVRLVDRPGYTYTLSPNNLLVYVAGDEETGIGNAVAAEGFDVRGGKGEISVASDKRQTVAVYAADGRKVRTVNVAAGSVERVGVGAGLYIVGGRKVVVK